MGRKNSLSLSLSLALALSLSLSPLSLCCEEVAFQVDSLAPLSWFPIPPFPAMSPPTRQFHRLSIGQDMPESRSSRAARAAGRPGPPGDEDESDPDGEDESSSGEGSSEEEDEEEGDSEDEESSYKESTNMSTVRARSGITYDLHHLDTDSEARALVGLTGQFDVVSCRASQSGYDFQLLDRPRVHIGPDSPTCTCSTFQGRPDMACHHIFVSGRELSQLPRHFNADTLSAQSGSSTSFMASSSPSVRRRMWPCPTTADLACMRASRIS